MKQNAHELMERLMRMQWLLNRYFHRNLRDRGVPYSGQMCIRDSFKSCAISFCPQAVSTPQRATQAAAALHLSVLFLMYFPLRYVLFTPSVLSL